MMWNHKAAKAVALHAGGTPAERLELLEMLGLVDQARVITPDDTSTHATPGSLNNADPGQSPRSRVLEPRPKNCTTPPGLANLPPLQPPAPKPAPVKAVKAVKVPKPRSRRPEAVCGSSGGRSKHVRAGEPVCQVCKDQAAEYARNHRAALREAGKLPTKRPRSARAGEYRRTNPDLPPRPETCGSLAGRSNHMRRGQSMCRPCATFYAAYCRERDQRKATRKAGEERSA